MTTETFTPSPPYTILGTGPYTIDHPYQDGDEIVCDVWLGNVKTVLVKDTDYTVAPDAGGSATTGDVYLSVAAEAAHRDSILIVRRETILEQGWLGSASAREKGLEVQLDRVIMGLQDTKRSTDGALRVAYGSVGVLPDAATRAGKGIRFDAITGEAGLTLADPDEALQQTLDASALAVASKDAAAASEAQAAIDAAAAAAAVAGQSIIKIETITPVSDVTEVDFALPAGYTKYILDLVDVHTAHDISGHELRMLMSDDGAVTFDTGNSYYSVTKPYTSGTIPTNVASMQIARSGVANGNQYYDGSVVIMGAQDTVRRTTILCDIVSNPTGAAIYTEEYVGTHNASAAQDAIRITMDGVDPIKAGSTFILYGVK